ncbi:MAG: thiamine pyrophosphate-dependent enzyme, partial [Dehalococcoidia bacterium]
GLYLERHRAARHILVKDAGWPDPSHLATDVVNAESARLCEELKSAIGKSPEASPWLEEWLDIRGRTKGAIDTSLGEMDELFEGKVFAELADLLPEESILFAGNSMPVRDMDAFFPSASKPVKCMANRGASGIDGVVSTALGVSAVSDRPVVLVLGDLSLYHDMNGLLAAKRHNLRATIIVLNNNGGGIFSFLPQAEHSDVFEEYFGTPHGLEFRSAAEMYGLSYAKVSSWGELREAFLRSSSSPGTTIIEVPGDRARNVELHRRVWASVFDVLRTKVKG